ncbi:hypothetical protein Hanom_Chr06g00533051 [Helianthus anomalus]
MYFQANIHDTNQSTKQQMDSFQGHSTVSSLKPTVNTYILKNTSPNKFSHHTRWFMI